MRRRRLKRISPVVDDEIMDSEFMEWFKLFKAAVMNRSVSKSTRKVSLGVENERRTRSQSALPSILDALGRFVLAVGLVIAGCEVMRGVDKCCLQSLKGDVNAVSNSVTNIQDRVSQLKQELNAISNKVVCLKFVDAGELLDQRSFTNEMENLRRSINDRPCWLIPLQARSLGCPYCCCPCCLRGCP